MRRRAILALAGAVATTIGHAAAHAQTAGSPRRVGRLSPLAAASDGPFGTALREGLREHGWTEGRDYVFVPLFAEGRLELLPGLAAELVRRQVDVIVTGSNPGALAARHATATIPIVMVTTGDPIGGGIVESLSRPGGNLTGVTALGEELNVKRLELLKQAFPGIVRVAVLVNPDSPYTESFLRAARDVAPALGLRLRALEARAPEALEAQFSSLDASPADALMVPPDVVFITHRARIAALAASRRLPAIYGEHEFVAAGGLMFYGASLPGMYRRAAWFVDRILKGARPGDLPIEQPTQFELAINLRVARALGLSVADAVLARADEVIE